MWDGFFEKKCPPFKWWIKKVDVKTTKNGGKKAIF